MSESALSDYGSEDAAAQTIAILTQLKAENVDLKRNFENLKALHLQLSENYKCLQGRYAALYEERNNVEKQYQSLCESWRVELEEKQRHLEAAKAQILGPRDMDVLRVKLLEELEGPYRGKCDNLEKEAESSHAAYIKLRREYEELQNNYRSLEVRTVGEQEGHRLELNALSRELKDKNATLIAAQGKLASSEAATRGLQRELEAARYTASQMKQELEEVRRAKERAVVERESAAMHADKKVKAAEEEAAQLMSYVESVGRKNRHLVQELAESQRAAEDLFAANVRLQSAQSQLQAQLDSAVRLAASERTALIEAHEEAVRKIEDKLTAALAEAGRKEAALAETKLSQQDELTKMLATWEGRSAEEKRAAAERVRELLDAKADVVERASATQRALEERIRETEAACRHAQAQADAAAREAAAEALRAQATSKQSTEAQTAVETLRSELTDVKSELGRCQLVVQQLNDRKTDLEQRLMGAEENALQVRAARDSLVMELESVRREAEDQRASLARASETARSAWGMEKAALSKRYQAALKELTTRHEAEMRKLKRKARGSMAAVAQLTDEVAELKFKAEEARHMNHVSEVMYLNSGPNTARTGSPYFGDHLLHSAYNPGSPSRYATAPAGGYGFGLRPTTAPPYIPPATQPNVVIVTGNGTAPGAMTTKGPSQQSLSVEGHEADDNTAATATAAASAAAGVVGSGVGRVGAGVVDAALLSSIAALRHRQQQYMDAARLGVQP